nr:ribonuclease H-like domain-containing protein [Tanacetum cinerariifolium]
PQLENEDLEQIDIDDLEEIDLKWQGNRNGDNTRRVVPVETPANALVVTNGMGYDWSYQAKEEPINFALMALSSSCSSSLDTEVRENSITKLKNQLKESLKEKDDLKIKLENFETSFKNLTNLINSQISPKDKTGLGYDSQMSERDLNNKSDVFESTSDSSVNESEENNNQANDRYKTGEGYHAVPPPNIGNFMPSKPDLSFARNFDPSSVITNSGKVPVNTAKQSSLRAASSISTARYVNTTACRPTINVVSAIQGNRKNDVKSSACWIWRPTGNVIDYISKDSGSYMLKRFNYVDLQGRLKCSSHMMGNKSFLTDYQEIDGGFVAFGGSPKGGKISGKDKIRTGKLDFEDNKVLVTKPHNKTPYELLIGRSPNLDFMRPFGCPVTILNTLDHRGKFEGKADEGFLVGYSIN